MAKTQFGERPSAYEYIVQVREWEGIGKDESSILSLFLNVSIVGSIRSANLRPQ